MESELLVHTAAPLRSLRIPWGASARLDGGRVFLDESAISAGAAAQALLRFSGQEFERCWRFPLLGTADVRFSLHQPQLKDLVEEGVGSARICLYPL